MAAEKHIAELVERLKLAAGANLESFVLFGSAVSEEFHPDFSDINTLCIVRELSAATLDTLAPVFAWWSRKKYPVPLLFSRTELEDSADVFAIELFDICQRHRIVYGENIFETMQVPMGKHRVQVEHDLRAKLLTIRQLYIEAGDDDNRVRKLMLDSVPNFGTLFRHAMIVLGMQPGIHRADAIRMLADRLKFDPHVFLQLFDVRARKVKESEMNARSSFAKYLEGIDKVIQAVDVL
jgi:predicted nucleotidyltransferase